MVFGENRNLGQAEDVADAKKTLYGNFLQLFTKNEKTPCHPIRPT